MLNRDALRACLPAGPVAVIAEAKRLGYVRMRFNNGLEVLATKDGSDWVDHPCFTMRQAKEFNRAWATLPLLRADR